MSAAGWRHLRRVFRLPDTTQRVRAEVDDEFRFHLEGRVEDLMRDEHLARADAEREALRRFGDLEAYREQARRIDETMLHRRTTMDLIDTFRGESRRALRSLLRAPSFSVVALVTLALGVGAATAIFTLLDRVVLRPLPFTNADRMIYVGTKWPGLKPGTEFGISRFMFFRFKQQSRMLDDIGVSQGTVFTLPADKGHEAERVVGVAASASMFHVLGVHPELGRLFTEDDQLPGDPSVVLLGHDLWVRRFGADPRIVGHPIDVGGRQLEVIGVLPRGARLPQSEVARVAGSWQANVDMWAPLHLRATDRPANNHVFSAIGLLKPGVTFQQSYAELGRLTWQIVQDYPNVYPARFMKSTGFGLTGRPLHDEVVGPVAVRSLWMLFASVALVLLIAAANVANLYLVRIDARRRDLAVRTALGADRRQLAIHYLSESGLLAMAAATLGVALAWALLHVALVFSPSSLPRLDEVMLDWRSVTFAILLAALAGATFGLLPLGQVRIDLGVIRDGRGLTRSRAQRSMRGVLVVTEVALAVLLLTSAGLMLRSFQRLHAVRPGFSATGVLTMDVALRSDTYRNETEILAFWHELARRISALPGVTGVGTTSSLPLDGDDGCTAVFAPESPLPESDRGQCVPTITAAPGYFDALRIQVSGHAPDWTDNERGAGQMVVSRALADRLWPGQNPVGKTLTYSMVRRLDFVVSGIAQDVRAEGLEKPPILAAYFPLTAPATAAPTRQPTRNELQAAYQHVVVRSTTGDFSALAAAVRRIVTEMDPRIPVSSVRPMELIVSASMARTTFTTMIMLLSAVIALTLSAVGLYGVISYVVGQRRAEIGIRMALGARSSDVSRLVVGQSIVLAAAGIVLGVGAALATTRLLGSLLYDVSPSDPAVLVLSCAVLLGAAVVASVGPAVRATRIDPVEAMRAS